MREKTLTPVKYTLHSHIDTRTLSKFFVSFIFPGQFISNFELMIDLKNIDHAMNMGPALTELRSGGGDILSNHTDK